MRLFGYKVGVAFRKKVVVASLTFVQCCTRRGALLLSFCPGCGRFVAASPSLQVLRIAELAHRCELQARKAPVSAGTEIFARLSQAVA